MTEISISESDQESLNSISEFITTGNLAGIKKILAKNGDLLIYPNFGVQDLGSLLHAAAAGGQLKICAHLVSLGMDADTVAFTLAGC